jgi:hypothetical protein
MSLLTAYRSSYQRKSSQCPQDCPGGGNAVDDWPDLLVYEKGHHVAELLPGPHSDTPQLAVLKHRVHLPIYLGSHGHTVACIDAAMLK